MIFLTFFMHFVLFLLHLWGLLMFAAASDYICEKKLLPFSAATCLIHTRTHIYKTLVKNQSNFRSRKQKIITWPQSIKYLTTRMSLNFRCHPINNLLFSTNSPGYCVFSTVAIQACRQQSANSVGSDGFS